eukprot:TRINITY_DN141147_c0_g1_i1.p2 TRINITY_DN141147_c0_g1~~TRINITY_DN141147_c0_g1_i1.p2  ORF type:complete len:113 (-),score=7.91 TRINITY_DN141147_c0_g1_i1:8-346(-)
MVDIIFIKQLVLVFHGAAHALQSYGLFYFRKAILEGSGKRSRCRRQFGDRLARGNFRGDHIYPVQLFVVLVVAELFCDIQANENAGGKPNGQAENIDEAERFVAGKETEIGS